MNAAGCCGFPEPYEAGKPANVQMVPRGCNILRYVECVAAPPKPQGTRYRWRHDAMTFCEVPLENAAPPRAPNIQWHRGDGPHARWVTLVGGLSL